MSLRIEDYALIGDTHTAALVGRDGSIDWLCLPRFDSGACFAALLGSHGNGRWLLAPAGEIRRTDRRYRGDTLVLETEFETDEGVVRVVDCMPPRQDDPDVVRVVEGIRGRVRMQMELVVRFDYGSTIPWATRNDGALSLVAGPDALCLRTNVPLRGRDLRTVAHFDVGAGQRVPFVLIWHPSNVPAPPGIDPLAAIDETEAWWSEWSATSTYGGEWADAVARSLVTLKALTYAPTGGIVAAPTSSLPEALGGERNWDYRYCWLRDATFTLYALMNAGYDDEAKAWRDWLLRAVAGDPSQLQIMYGPAGERRLPEWEVPWLAGYEGSKPVRMGNAAVNQFQLDVYGEVMDTLLLADQAGLVNNREAWNLADKLLEFVESAWQRPDEGIWEVRGPRRHFTHSKVMAWVAADRAVAAVERFHQPGPVDRWRELRDAIHREVTEQAWNDERGCFTQSYGSDALDAALLQLPLVGFLPAGDPRVVATVAAIERELVQDGFVRRYETSDGASTGVDGLRSTEGAFLPCTFWLADNYAQQGRLDEGRELFERLLSLRNDVGLLAEEYDPASGRLVGNFPQAWTHVSLINTARNLTRGDLARRPARHRAGRSD